VKQSEFREVISNRSTHKIVAKGDSHLWKLSRILGAFPHSLHAEASGCP
jgi:hypothetical protein